MAKAEPSLECRHIRINGTKCRSAALTDNAWCYFHERIYREQREQHANQAAARRNQLALPETTLDYGCIPVTQPIQRDQIIALPLLEDLSSIQFAISCVVHALAANTIDPKRAGLLLYGLQIAAQNIPKDEPKSWHTVSDIAQTEDGTPISLVEPGKPRTESFASLAKRLRLKLKEFDALQSGSQAG